MPPVIRAAPDGVEPNSASRALAASIEALFTSDWDTARALWAPETVSDDRRTLGAGIAHGRDALIDAAKQVVGVGFSAYELTPIAAEGDRLALVHHELATEDGFVMEFVALGELNEMGQLSRVVYFATDDLDAAHAELAERHRFVSGFE